MTDRDLPDERMDRRLRDRGARWRETLPLPAEPAPAGGPDRRRWLVPAAAAGAVAVVLGVTFVVTGGDRERDDAVPAGSDSPSTAGPSTARTLTVAPPEAAAPCGPGDLVATERHLEGAAGTSYLTTGLVLARGSAPCSIEGYPEVVLMDHGEVVPVEVVHDAAPTEGPIVVAGAAAPVAVVISWSRGHHCPPIDNDTILLRAGDGAEVQIDGFGQTSCNPGEGEQPVHVRPFLPIERDYAGETEVAENTGTVTGTITLDGGPPPGTSTPVTSGEVSFAAEGFEAVVSLAEDGTFRTDLPPGEYAVTVTTPQWNSGAPYSDGAFGVTGGTTNELDIIIPIE